MLTDVKFAIRGFLRTPGFTLTALATLALCLGANLTIFSVIDSVLLRPLPFPAADRLVTMYNTYPKAGVVRDGSSITNYYERRGNIPAFASISMYRTGSALVGDPGATERTDIMMVSPEFFTTLGAAPAIGRSFREQETTHQTNDVAILTDSWWRQHYRADPSIIGQTVRIDGVTATIVGVLPPSYRFLSFETRLFVPYAVEPSDRLPSERHSGRGLDLVARLRPGATVEEAQSQIDAQNALLERDDPDAKMVTDAGFRTPVVALHADHVRSIRPVLILLQVGVLLLVLIGCVNLVNLLLIRASARAREVAIRQSMGATWRHVIGGVLTETVVLTMVGGVLGLLVGVAGLRLLAYAGIAQLPLGAMVAVNTRVALFGLAGAALLGILVGVPIAWFNLRAGLADTLKSETRGGTATRGAQRLRHGFIVAQVALAFVLLAGSGLLGVSLRRAMAVAPGFNADHVLTGTVTLPFTSYGSTDARVAFTDRLIDGIRHQPGAVAVGIGTNLPLSGRNNVSGIAVRGHVPRPGESVHAHYLYGVTGDYFAALGIPLREGRVLRADDAHGGRRLAVVDEDFARQYWPDRSALGEQFFQGTNQRGDNDAFTIVGVVGNVRQADVTDARQQGAVYLPYSAASSGELFVVTRTRQSPEALATTLSRVVRSLDPDLPVDGVRSMETRVSDSLVARRSPALLLSIFAVVALLLAAVGTYGVLSYAVAQRRREIGVRLALGARPQQVGTQFLSVGARLLALGTVIGVLGTWMAGRLMQRVLFDVPALHPATLAGAALVMGVVTLVASYIPARRAARVDPLVALGSE